MELNFKSKTQFELLFSDNLFECKDMPQFIFLFDNRTFKLPARVGFTYGLKRAELKYGIFNATPHPYFVSNDGNDMLLTTDYQLIQGETQYIITAQYLKQLDINTVTLHSKSTPSRSIILSTIAHT